MRFTVGDVLYRCDRPYLRWRVTGVTPGHVQLLPLPIGGQRRYPVELVSDMLRPELGAQLLHDAETDDE